MRELVGSFRTAETFGQELSIPLLAIAAVREDKEAVQSMQSVECPSGDSWSGRQQDPLGLVFVVRYKAQPEHRKPQPPQPPSLLAG